MPPTFDPNAAAPSDAGVFGLPTTQDDAAVILIPVPFDATTSYRAGTAAGPEAIRTASFQVDLYDHRFGAVYQHGIWMAPNPTDIADLSQSTRALTQPILDGNDDGGSTDQHIETIDASCEQVRSFVRSAVESVLARSKRPGIIGGEHAISLGAVEAVATHHESIGVLQIDAHMDLRRSYEGFKHSHASIMHNVLAEVPGVERIVQIGVRDYCEEEREAALAAGDRVRVHCWPDIHDALAQGQSVHSILLSTVEQLPQRVYVSCDIDGLDPSLCPHTGTPVPGGLAFEQVGLLLQLICQSGRQIVGFDVVEVAPDPTGASEWDANVGARMVYRLCGAACWNSSND